MRGRECGTACAPATERPPGRCADGRQLGASPPLRGRSPCTYASPVGAGGEKTAFHTPLAHSMTRLCTAMPSGLDASLCVLDVVCTCGGPHVTYTCSRSCSVSYHMSTPAVSIVTQLVHIHIRNEALHMLQCYNLPSVLFLICCMIMAIDNVGAALYLVTCHTTYSFILRMMPCLRVHYIC